MFMQNATAFRPAEKIALSLHGLGHAHETPAAGLLAGCLVETDTGWRPVERLTSGTRVATYDGGFRPIARVERHHVWPSAEAELVHVPGGALDNCEGISLRPGQHVFLADPIAEEVLGAAGAFVPASALVGFRGITRRLLTRPAEVLTLRFAIEEVVYVNSGTLVHCAAESPFDGGGAVRSDYFEILDDDRALAMLALVQGAALTTGGLGRAA